MKRDPIDIIPACNPECAMHTWHCLIRDDETYINLFGQLFSWPWIDLRPTVEDRFLTQRLDRGFSTTESNHSK